MPTSLNLLDSFSNDPAGYGPTGQLDMTQPAFANTLPAYKTIHHQALIGILGDVANSSINKDEFYLRMIFSYVTTILEAGLTPDPRNWTQMIDAIKAFAEKANIHDSTKTYKQGARVQDGVGGAWYEAVQDVPVNTLITNPLYWLPSSNFKIFNSDDVLTTGRALTANDINKHFIFNNTLPQTFDLPPVNSIPSGSVIYVRGGQSIATFNRSGSDTINVINSGTVLSCSCFGSETIMLVSNGGGDWRLTKINPRHSTFTTFSPVFGTSFENATIYTNGSGFSQKISSRVYLPSVETAIFIAIDNTIVFDEIVNSTTKTANLRFDVPPRSTYRFWLGNAATFSNNITTVQSVTI